MLIKLIVVLGMSSSFLACGRSIESPLKNDTLAADNNSSVNMHWKTLPVKLKMDPTLTQVQRDGLLSAIKTWEDAVGINLIDIDGFDKNNVHPNDPESLIADSVNGVYVMKDWASMKGKDVTVLATTIWKTSVNNPEIITSADLMFNESHYNWIDTLALADEKRDADFETVCLHELGHFLGIPHTAANIDTDSIMNPTVQIGKGLAKRTLSKTDIDSIRKRYGCAESLNCN